MASGDNLAQLAALAQIAAMSTEMNLNNQQQNLKESKWTNKISNGKENML